MSMAMRWSTLAACLTLTAVTLVVGSGPRAALAQGQAQPPPFVDERRLPVDGGAASKVRQSDEALKLLKDESDRLREQLSVETEARRKAEEEAARQTAGKVAEEAAAREKARQDEISRQAAEAARQATQQEEAAREKARQDEISRQAAESRRTTAAQDLAQRMSSGGACRDVQVAAQALPAGRLEIKLRSPCLAGRPVTFVYAGHEFARTLDGGGSLTFVLDMFEGRAPLALKLEDATTTNIDTSSVNFAQVSKVAVLWSAPVNLDLHAFEYLAPRGGPGHVWAKSPANLDAAVTAARDGGARGRGFLSTADSGEGAGLHAEVYTFLHNKNQRQGVVTLMLDYETRGDMPSGEYCGEGRLAAIEALVVRLRPGGSVEKETVRLGSAPCGQKLPDAKRFNSDTLSDLLARQ